MFSEMKKAISAMKIFWRPPATANAPRTPPLHCGATVRIAQPRRFATGNRHTGPGVSKLANILLDGVK